MNALTRDEIGERVHAAIGDDWSITVHPERLPIVPSGALARWSEPVVHVWRERAMVARELPPMATLDDVDRVAQQIAIALTEWDLT